MSRPDFVYDSETSRFKPFGVEKGATVMALPVVGLLGSVLLYIIVLIYTLLTNQLAHN
jgi:hypothetical protein